MAFFEEKTVFQTTESNSMASPALPPSCCCVVVIIEQQLLSPSLLMSSASRPASALMCACAIRSVSILDNFCSVVMLGTTSRSLSNASFRPFMRFRSRALAASRRCLRISGDGGRRFFLRPPFFRITRPPLSPWWPLAVLPPPDSDPDL